MKSNGYPSPPVAGLLCTYVWPVAGVTVGSLLLSPLQALIDLSNVAMLYVLAVVVAAVRFGRGPAVLTALLSAFCFAYVFVPPHFSLAITEAQYLLAAVIMLVVALIVGHLTSRLKHHADESLRRSQASRTLYRLARELAAMRTPAEVQASATRFLETSLAACDVRFIGEAVLAAGDAVASPAMLQACVDRRQLLSKPLANGNFLALLPMVAGSGVQGVLGIELPPLALTNQDAVEHLETIASLVAVALERSRYAERVRETEVRHAAEALRASILAALSHDLRTPLTALVGMADTLALARLGPEKQKALLEALRNQALSLSQQMTNLLDMARLTVGKLQIDTAWQPIEEVLGATLQAIHAQWPSRELKLDLQADLPPVSIDAVLMERVFWNLIENAIKYAPAGEPVDIQVRQSGGNLQVDVCDRGPGVPDAIVSRLFEAFQRGSAESAIPGVGLGLSIARTIVEAHGGALGYRPRATGGSCFCVSLPLGQPPKLDFTGN